MLLTMLAVSILVFFLLEVNGEAVAIKVLGPYTSPEQRALWLEANGYLQPWYIRYFTWLGDVVTGDFGQSVVFKVPVAPLVRERLTNTAILAVAVFAVMETGRAACGERGGQNV